METVADQRPTGINRRSEIGLIHEGDLTETIAGGEPLVALSGPMMLASAGLVIAGSVIELRVRLRSAPPLGSR
jgi:hypothetical protein